MSKYKYVCYEHEKIISGCDCLHAIIIYVDECPMKDEHEKNINGLRK